MDIVLEFLDDHVFDTVYPESVARDNMFRQLISLLTIVNIGGFIIYMLPASFSYFFLFDKRHLNHPQILPVSLFFLLSMIFYTTVSFIINEKSYQNVQTNGSCLTTQFVEKLEPSIVSSILPAFGVLMNAEAGNACSGYLLVNCHGLVA